MACKGCIARQERLVRLLCRKMPCGTLCRKARLRLERMKNPVRKSK